MTSSTLCSGEYADAPFCSGPSDQGPARNPCEDLGTCDDSFTDACVEVGLSFDYSTGECIGEPVLGPATESGPDGEAIQVVPGTSTPIETLPETGFDGLLILVVGVVAIAAGLWIYATGGSR